MRSGISPDSRSSTTHRSRVRDSPKNQTAFSASSSAIGPKEFLNRFIDSDAFGIELHTWLHEHLLVQQDGCSHFEVPFQLDELRQFDFALEGVLFQQLMRMPLMHLSSSAPSTEAEMCLAVEDFLYASARGLWDTFWRSEDILPFFVTGSHSFSSRSSSGEKNSTKGRVGRPHCAALVSKSGSGAQALWEHIGEFVLLKFELGNVSRDDELVLSPNVMCQAIFYGLYMLLSRKSAHGKPSIHKNQDVAYILLVDSQYGGVVRLKGDINALDMHTSKVYESAAQWVQKHAHVALSSMGKVWNRFGNANWGDWGALHLLLATFHCMEQYQGSPKKAIVEVATEHNTRLQQRRVERRLLEVRENGSESVRRHQTRSQGEIVEIEEAAEPEIVKNLEHLKLESGTILWLEDSHWQRGFKILEDLGGERHNVYSCSSLEEANKLLNVYVGAHPSQLEPSWEDMSTWYQVQRQTRVLNTMKQKGVSSKYLPQLIASGRILHPGSCTKKSPGGRCDHPWCGTPILVTFPVGESLTSIIEKKSLFSSEEALRCCHDCLSALRSSGSIGIQHGDITPEHVIRVTGADGENYYVLVEWGHAVLEDRDSPAISPCFSSTYALQEGKLCPASDAESLVYLLYFLCGGNTPQFDSIEAALQWRERSWTRRVIQQQLGEVSAVLKAFADYVDSLCGTPYPVDCDIWLRRLSRALHGEDPGKRIEYNVTATKRDDIAESSGTSGAL
eukprot:c28271_g1_i1 orf=336-2528(-)